MTSAEWVSLTINLAIAVYFIHFYPKTLVKTFRDHPIPKGFLVVRGIIKVVGYVVLIGSAGYAVLRLSGTV